MASAGTLGQAPRVVRFEDVQERASAYMDARGMLVVQRAYVFCARAHHGQSRMSGEPYLVHPLEVAAILADMRMDPACVAVGLLHDVLEDTLTDPERIKEYFGEDVLLAEPGDPDSIAAALAATRSDPEAAVSRAERASGRLREIEWARQRRGYLDLIDGLVAARRS